MPRGPRAPSRWSLAKGTSARDATLSSCVSTPPRPWFPGQSDALAARSPTHPTAVGKAAQPTGRQTRGEPWSTASLRGSHTQMVHPSRFFNIGAKCPKEPWMGLRSVQTVRCGWRAEVGARCCAPQRDDGSPTAARSLCGGPTKIQCRSCAGAKRNAPEPYADSDASLVCAVGAIGRIGHPTGSASSRSPP